MCSFDNTIHEIFTEVHFWDKLHIEEFEVPHVLLPICHRREVLGVLREQVIMLVQAYNKLLDDIPETPLLFSVYLRQLEKRIIPGFSRLVWSTRPPIIERFVQVIYSPISPYY